MGGLLSIDFGTNIPGESGIAATGTTILTAYLLHKKVTVFTSVTPGAIALLPGSYASGTELKVLNRSGNDLLISPGANNQIEGYGIGVAVAVAGPGNANFTSFDPPASAAPRTWWLT